MLTDIVQPQPPLTPSGALERAPLRRLDWRFLLPPPISGCFGQLVLLGGSAAFAASLLDLGVAEHVSCTLPTATTADALIILHGAHVELADVARCVAPGGVVYWEIDRHTDQALHSVARRLRQLGFATSTYAVSPRFERAGVYLPLGVPGALRWYLGTQFKAATPALWLMEWALRAASSAHVPLGRWVPHVALVAVRGARPATPAVLQHLLLPNTLRQPGVQAVLLADGGNRVTMLPFARDGSQPLAVLKVPKLPSFNGRTMHEQTMLADIWAQARAAVRASIPQPLGVVPYGDVVISAEQYLAGQSLVRLCNDWGMPLRRKIAAMQQAAAWLASFHAQALVQRTAWGVDEIAQWVDEPLGMFARQFGTTPAEARLFAAARQRADELRGSMFPIVWQHRDFNIWNVYRHGAQINVIDWEGCRPGPALSDLLHFLTHWHEAVCALRDDSARAGGVGDLFGARPDRCVPAAAAQQALEQYMQHLALDRRFVPLLLVYTWVELALRRAEQQRDGGVTPAAARTENNNFVYITGLCQSIDALFENP